jgi:fibronectin-binding autotransporter adhesin
MANRYWVGGTGNWDFSATTNWSDTSGGAAGFSAPTLADDVFFDGGSGGGVVTVTGLRSCANITFTGFTGTLTGSGVPIIDFYGSCTLAATMTVNSSVGPFFRKFGATTGTFTSAGKTIRSFELGSASTLSLSDAIVSAGSITVTQGTFTTNNYAVTATSLSSSNNNVRTINLGSSTLILSVSQTPWNVATTTGLTFNAGSSTINCTGASATFNGGGLTYNNVSFTSTIKSAFTITGENTFNTLLSTARNMTGIYSLTLSADQTISTLTLSAGTNATIRAFLRSSEIGTTRTLNVGTFTTTADIDFLGITIAGAAAPVSGTRLGDCKGNSGITFPAAKTVFWRGGGGNWGANNWSATNGGAIDATQFPLAQDTATIPSGFPASGNTITINAVYNIGTIDMSARTSNTMTLATGSNAPFIYGNWINGTGTTLTGTGTLTFAGRGSQTITNAGRTFTQRLQVNTPNGSVTLQDAFITSLGSSSAIDLIAGTLDANGYNATTSAASSGIAAGGSALRTLALGSGTWTLSGTGGWNITGSNLTVTGTGTISMTSASNKTFVGGGIQTYPTLNQGGTGTLTVTGSNKFAGLTNTAIGRIQFTGGTTNEFTSFTISGALGNLLQLGSTNTTQAILQKPTAWNMGVLSMDMGNNTGLNFFSNDGSMEYLSVSYINGQVSTPAVTYTGNFFAFF